MQVCVVAVGDHPSKKLVDVSLTKALDAVMYICAIDVGAGDEELTVTVRSTCKIKYCRT